MKRILIVGGMGPQASLELHSRIIQHANVLGAANGDDFPHIVHVSLPIDDFISDERKTGKALGIISSTLERLYLRQGRPSGYSV